MMRDDDPVERDLRIHLAKMDVEDSVEDAIEEITEYLLAGEYGPFTPDNLREALGEIDVGELSALLDCGRDGEAGAAIARFARDYWRAAARMEAALMIDERDRL